MKYLALELILLFTFSSCASIPSPSKPQEEIPAAPRNSAHAFAEKPDQVLRAARAVLMDLLQESEPPVPLEVRGQGSMVYTGWVYATGPFRSEGDPGQEAPPTQPQQIRRRVYAFTITPAPSGSLVELTIHEEFQELDSGKTWRRTQTKPTIFDQLLRKLRKKIREN